MSPGKEIILRGKIATLHHLQERLEEITKLSRERESLSHLISATKVEIKRALTRFYSDGVGSDDIPEETLRRDQILSASGPTVPPALVGDGLAINKKETRDLYRRRAKRYDFLAKVYGLVFGFRLEHYRKATVAALALKPGDLVVELGCGTGLNFRHVQRAIGPGGKIIGVDLTDAMLDVARDRIVREKWTNVELVQADLSEWEFPKEVSAAFSTLALTLVPEYDFIIERASRALKAEGRLAVMDLKEPVGWPSWFLHFVAWFWRPFGVSLDLADRHPWESIRRHLTEIEYREFYSGAVYLSVGKKASPLG